MTEEERRENKVREADKEEEEEVGERLRTGE